MALVLVKQTLNRFAEANNVEIAEAVKEESPIGKHLLKINF